jgi:hypothetical protein
MPGLDRALESTVTRPWFIYQKCMAGWGDYGQFVVASSDMTQAVVEGTTIRRVTFSGGGISGDPKESGRCGFTSFANAG